MVGVEAVQPPFSGFKPGGAVMLLFIVYGRLFIVFHEHSIPTNHEMLFILLPGVCHWKGGTIHKAWLNQPSMEACQKNGKSPDELSSNNH
jgi:hypothetical protein